MGKRASYSFLMAYALAAVCLSVILSLAGCGKKTRDTNVAPPPTVAQPMIDPWKKAARSVEEDRGEPIGRKADVEVPAELKHYSDRRRFLAVQMAEWREQNYKIPHDFAELVELVREGQFVEMEPLGEDYILYGVGANATDGPFTHYDTSKGDYIPLYASVAEFEREYSDLNDSLRQLQGKINDLQKEIKQTPKRDRSRRSMLAGQVSEAQKSRKDISDKKKLLEFFYKNNDRRKQMSGEYKTLMEFASNFDGKSYDLSNAAQRQSFRVRLLSFIRPEARDVILEIARAYKEEFDRPLPITSLVRTEQYQRHLSETNPNATRTAVPPHTTGLAFDIYYHYMTAAEQDHLMGVIAKLKSEGRLEALRETRDHIHVFAFPDGQRPGEELIAQSIGNLGGKARQPENKQASARSKSKGVKVARSRSGKRSSRSASVAKGRNKKGKTVARASHGK